MRMCVCVYARAHACARVCEKHFFKSLEEGVILSRKFALSFLKLLLSLSYALSQSA